MFFINHSFILVLETLAYYYKAGAGLFLLFYIILIGIGCDLIVQVFNEEI